MAAVTLGTATLSLHGKTVHKAEATEFTQQHVIFCPACKTRVVAIRRMFRMGVKLVNSGVCPCLIQKELLEAASSSSSLTSTSTSSPPTPAVQLTTELDVLHDSYARLEELAGDQAHSIVFLKGEIRQIQAKLQDGVVSHATLASKLQGIVAMAMPDIEAAIEERVRREVQAHVSTLASADAADGRVAVAEVETLACTQQLRLDLHELSCQLVAVQGKSARAEQTTKQTIELLLQQLEDLRAVVESDQVQYGNKDDLNQIQKEFAEMAHEFSSFRRVIRKYKDCIDGLASMDERIKSLERKFGMFEDIVTERLTQVEDRTTLLEERIAELERLVHSQRDGSVDQIQDLNRRLDELILQQQQQQQHTGTMVLPTEQHRLEQLKTAVDTMMHKNSRTTNDDNNISVNSSNHIQPSANPSIPWTVQLPPRLPVEPPLSVNPSQQQRQQPHQQPRQRPDPPPLFHSTINEESLPHAYAVEDVDEYQRVVGSLPQAAAVAVTKECHRVVGCQYHSRGSGPIDGTSLCYHDQLLGLHQPIARTIEGLQQIADNAHDDDGFRVTFATSPCGTSSIVQAMQQHGDHAGVQELGCLALRNLATNNDQNKMTIAAKGGIDVIVKAIQRHADHAGVQEKGCRALGNLAVNYQNNVNIAAKGGIDVIVKAMQRHGDHAVVQEYGCAALCNLASNDQNQVTIAAKGGIDVIVKAMQRHGDHAVVQEYGCWTLRNLAANNDQNKETIAAKGGIDVIVKAMQRHSDHAGVQEQGNLALTNLGVCRRGLISAMRNQFSNVV
jgi:hypothetical protein